MYAEVQQQRWKKKIKVAMKQSINIRSILYFLISFLYSLDVRLCLRPSICKCKVHFACVFFSEIVNQMCNFIQTYDVN